MDVFPTSVPLVSIWCPGPEPHLGRTGKGNPFLKASLARPPPQPHAPTPSSARATGASPDVSVSRNAQVAVAGSILVTVRKLLADPARQHDTVGPEFYDHRIGPERHQGNHIHKLETLGYTVTLNPAA